MSSVPRGCPQQRRTPKDVECGMGIKASSKSIIYLGSSNYLRLPGMSITYGDIGGCIAHLPSLRDPRRSRDKGQEEDRSHEFQSVHASIEHRTPNKQPRVMKNEPCTIHCTHVDLVAISRIRTTDIPLNNADQQDTHWNTGHEHNTHTSIMR